MKQLEDNFLLAVDEAHNSFGYFLSFEEWCMDVDLDQRAARQLRTRLENKGIL